MEHANKDGIAEALKLLDEAAKQKKDDLKNAIADKYTHLRSAILETENGFVQSLLAAKKSALDAAGHARDVSAEKAREIAGDVDKSVHRNPWPYIAGTAGAGLLLGFLLGRHRP